VLWAFAGIAVVVTVTPGAATAMVVRSALRGGWRAGMRTIAGNEIGVVAWALLSVLGVSALVAASEVAFVALKVAGAIVLVGLGVQALLRGGDPSAVARPALRPFRAGVLTSLANPKLAVFFVALFPQFVPARASVLPATLLMTALVVVFDLVWYSALAIAVGRAKHVLMRTSLARRIEQAMGAVLIGLGVRVALERR
jgi:threonine/homoserine/homoserine lactone efflux protein